MMKVLVPVDGSDHAYAALEMAKSIAEQYDGGTVVVTNVQRKKVSRPKPMEFDVAEFIVDNPKILEEMGQRIIEKGLEMLKDSPVKVASCLLLGDPAEQIIECAKRHEANMIVMGSVGLTGLSRFLMGSVSTKVVGYAEIPVLIVKKPK